MFIYRGMRVVLMIVYLKSSVSPLTDSGLCGLAFLHLLQWLEVAKLYCLFSHSYVAFQFLLNANFNIDLCIFM